METIHKAHYQLVKPYLAIIASNGMALHTVPPITQQRLLVAKISDRDEGKHVDITAREITSSTCLWVPIYIFSLDKESLIIKPCIKERNSILKSQSHRKQQWRIQDGGKEGMSLPSKNRLKQESIPVRCVSPISNHTCLGGQLMSVSVGGALKWTNLKRFLVMVPDVTSSGPEPCGDPCLMSREIKAGAGKIGRTGETCTMRSNVSWVVVTWGAPVDRQTRLKTLPYGFLDPLLNSLNSVAHYY